MPKESTGDEFQDAVHSMADRLKLEGKDREQYVHEHMTRAGYKTVRSYVKSDEGDEAEGSTFFGRRKKSSDNDW